MSCSARTNSWKETRQRKMVIIMTGFALGEPRIVTIITVMIIKHTERALFANVAV